MLLGHQKKKKSNVKVNFSDYNPIRGFPSSSVVKNPSANAGDEGSTPWSRRSPGEGNGNPLQYSCLGNPSPWSRNSLDTTEAT